MHCMLGGRGPGDIFNPLKVSTGTHDPSKFCTNHMVNAAKQKCSKTVLFCNSVASLQSCRHLYPDWGRAAGIVHCDV